MIEAALSTAQDAAAPWATEGETSVERGTAAANAGLADRAPALGLGGIHDVDGGRRSVADEVRALVGAATMDGGAAVGLEVARVALGRAFAPGPVALLV